MTRHRTLPGAHRRPRVVLYGHDTQGLGHLRRNLALAELFASGDDGADVLILSGAPEAGLFPRPPGVEVLVMPGVRKDAAGGYGPRALRGHLDEVVDLRRATILAALATFEPDLVVVDKTPRGFAGELSHVLPLLRARGTRTVLGLRDVLDDPTTAARQWRQDDGDEAVRRWYDEVWVYGDAQVHDLTEACAMAPDVVARCRHVGYLSAGRTSAEALDHRPPVTTQHYVMGVVGGGQDGGPLARAIAAAEVPAAHTLVLVGGPQLPDTDLRKLRDVAAGRDDLLVMRFSRHCAAWLAGSSAVVAMAGSNTVAELLSTDVPALLVPRVRPRQEQLVRALGLQARGLVEVMHPDDLHSGQIGAWLSQATRRRVCRAHLDLGGLTTVARRAATLVGLPHKDFSATANLSHRAAEPMLTTRPEEPARVAV